MTIEIVDFPINSMVIFPSYVSLPEGTPSSKRDAIFYSPNHSFFGKIESIVHTVQTTSLGGLASGYD